MVLLVCALSLSHTPVWTQTSSGLDINVVVEPGSALGEGWIIAAPRYSSNLTYPMVVDANGDVVLNDLRPYQGFSFEHHPDGRLAWFSTFENHWEVLDSSLQVASTIEYVADDVDYHDLELMPNGRVLLLGKEIITLDVSDSVSDPSEPDRAVINCLLQEQDSLGNVLWAWRASDYLPPTLCTHCNWDSPLIDAYHHNAFQVLENGDILLCLRNMDKVVRINRQTGQVVWTLGGALSNFTFSDPTTLFRHPHDAQFTASGNLLLFDNGTGKEPLVSRGVEYSLDLETAQATQVQQWLHPNGNYASSQGSVQRLENGGTLIGWGTGGSDAFGGGMITEYDATGDLVGSVYFPTNHYSYRARKVPASQWPVIQDCRNPTACNYNPDAAIDGICLEEGMSCDDGNPCTSGDMIQADCSCLGEGPAEGSPIGCSDPFAINFNPCAFADVDDGSCQYLVNFRVDATAMDSLPETMSLSLSGNLIALSEGGFGTWKGSLVLGNGVWQHHFVADGGGESVVRSLSINWPLSAPLSEQRACFGLEAVACPGCTDPDDVAFSPFAADDLLCGGGSWNGCTWPEALNYSATAIFDDGSCAFSEESGCAQDLDGDGLVSVSDVLSLLAYFGTFCP